MEASQALIKYKEKMKQKMQPKMQPKIQTKIQPQTPILYSTQREIEWFKKICPNFEQNIHCIKYIK